jgi:hypothetical protein
MSKPDPKDLTILLWSEKWSNEEHRFIDQLWIVVHGEDVLCQGIPRFPYMIYEPIKWHSYQECHKWVDSGCIGDIQEGLTNLNILFTNKIVKRG